MVECEKFTDLTLDEIAKIISEATPVNKIRATAWRFLFLKVTLCSCVIRTYKHEFTNTPRAVLNFLFLVRELYSCF